MIVPYPEELKDLKRFPLTLTLVFLNVFIFLLFFSGTSSLGLMDSSLLHSEGMTVTGRLYHQYLQELSPTALYERPAWVREIKSSNVEQMGVLGAYALRDGSFLAQAENKDYRGDQVQITQWKKDLVEFRKGYQQELLYRFGLSSAVKNPSVWVTYQFSHSTWIHLLSNLLFLVFIGIAVEAVAGSGALLGIYLLGGLFGGLGFLFSDGHGAVPMVGASASISALLAFYCFAEMRARVRFLYFLSPLPGQYGPIYLPTLLIIPLFLLVDLANFWSTPEGLGGGVAYAAHLGGSLLGLMAAVVYRLQRRAVFRQP